MITTHAAPLDALRQRLIARRVRGGFNPDESVTMLAEVEATFGPGTLAAALHYQGFATPAGAEKAADQLLAAKGGAR